ncbi:FAD-binding protein [Flavilitoribacter nigricans]|uniref:FAD-binding PCMH-type domain-containing protein n=1 Tax=Flavilitoribacter nigricans (strain ATCC 23147 / DSM 23189 / NBRC 102662 / NCIMB 1420 / SS-2) TaxID=1122177 RepID=A0A2D0MX86_FLAN2|nr:FAD-binding protein [Flavilitoribacter nigricans]PHN00827.1 hypothetical protein CRP01_40285 [Flavilitoribacter nigricans DSM 23189 = NBRC 102662]
MKTNLKNISRDRYTWYNCTGNVKVSPLRFFYPRTKEQIAEIVREAERRELRVRAVGSGHSFSEAAKGKDFLLSMKRMAGVSRPHKETLRTKFREMPLVSAQAGIVIRRLNRTLDRMGLALINMGVIDVQTLSGAIMTGTHGTGIGKPTMPDMVRSLKLVGTGGRFFQIEPTDGITDPDQHGSTNPIELIQDDDTFYSTILSFGGMGIIYEMTLEVKPQYKMLERRYLKPWSELEQELRNGSFMRQLKQKDFMAFRINPYKVSKGNRCAVVEQDIVGPDEKPRRLFALRKNLIFQIFSNLEFLIEGSVRRFRNSPNAVAKTIQLGLWSTKDTCYYGPSYKVLYQAGTAVLRHGISAEFAFEATGEKVIEVINAIIDQTKKNKDENGLYQSSYVSVRFVAPSRAYLSSAYDRATVYVDIPLLFGTIGDLEILERYQDLMIDMGGIPHWGKHNLQLYLRNDFIREQFARVGTWMAIRDRLDPKKTFLNDFIIKMGLGSKKAKRKAARLQKTGV